MTTLQDTNGPVPGWIGGFAQSDPAFAYPDPNLTSLPLLGNMEKIKLLDRQQGVEWPEFSWETEKGNADPKRCFQMFAPYISRIGYTDEGKVYSIICPQQGVYHEGLGTMNVEVTVLKQRGWVDETTKELAAEMSVEGKIWFSPSAHQNWLVKLAWDKFKDSKLPFPSDKANAIRVTTHKFKDPGEPVFPVRTGETKRFQSPGFARHPEAWAVGNVEVEIGPIHKTGYPDVDRFNELVMEVFNAASGNMLQPGNLLSWNVWFRAPELVDRKEWQEHAEKWRESIDVDHRSPDGDGTIARFFHGAPFEPAEALMERVYDDIKRWIEEHL